MSLTPSGITSKNTRGKCNCVCVCVGLLRLCLCLRVRVRVRVCVCVRVSYRHCRSAHQTAHEIKRSICVFRTGRDRNSRKCVQREMKMCSTRNVRLVLCVCHHSSSTSYPLTRFPNPLPSPLCRSPPLYMCVQLQRSGR